MPVDTGLGLPRPSAKFEMERPRSSRSAASSSESLAEGSGAQKSKGALTEQGKPRFSTTTMKYAQMPLPTPPDSAGLEGYKLQLTLMPPTPGHAPSGYASQSIKMDQKSLPYHLTVEDMEDDTECFSPSSTNYSAPSEYGGMEAADFLRESCIDETIVPKPLNIRRNEDRKPSGGSITGAASTAAPANLTPLAPQTPVSPSMPLAKAARASGMSLAERRAAKTKSGVKIPTPLSSPNRAESGEGLPISPPPLTSRSAAHVEAGRLATPRTVTPRTATFGSVPKPDVSTPRSATFATLPAPPTVPASKSPKSATFSPRSIAFSPIHEDVDREKLRTPTAVNMLVDRARESQQGFVSGLMSPVILNQFQTLWNVANAQVLINQVFQMGMFREDSFTFTGAEHFTFGADPTAAFYRLSAHPSHPQDALFSDLKIHRANPATQCEVPVIHLQLEAPTLEASGVVALIYPQVAAMLEDKKHDPKGSTKFDVTDEAECCRLVYEPGKGFALFHPAKDEEGGWLDILVTGRVGFDVVGANGSISISSSTHDHPLVTLDFATAQLTINTAACNTINSFYIIDVAVAAVMTVATVEGRRLRAIQEDLDQILAYEMANGPDAATPQSEAPEYDFSFATAMGRETQDARKKQAGHAREKSGVGKALGGFLKALARLFKSCGGKRQKKATKLPSGGSSGKSREKPGDHSGDFQFPFQHESRGLPVAKNEYPPARPARHPSPGSRTADINL
ncbi:hypothetical protein DRE_01030 [Drechslerella stenobrocha 248]|uniref:Uncharacterized protein n=1 Tax=Drechslerella stenobrocha 248 TaxID=1043628 RepID=W7HLX5_9PEZI|nr:hypothetical protein DRE_01030 [Drechslerella stenobrocha 248]